MLLLLMIAVHRGDLLVQRRFLLPGGTSGEKIPPCRDGDLSVSEKISGTDEIAVLDQQFNRMLGKLDQLIKTSYVQKLEKKRHS